MDSKKIKKPKLKGVAVLLIVVVIAAVGLILAFSLFFLGLGELDLSYTLDQGQKAMLLAEGCLEESLRRIMLDPDYGLVVGNISLSREQGSCIIEITSDAPFQRRIFITASFQDKYYKKILAEITLSDKIYLNKWQETN